MRYVNIIRCMQDDIIDDDSDGYNDVNGDYYKDDDGGIRRKLPTAWPRLQAHKAWLFRQPHKA